MFCLHFKGMGYEATLGPASCFRVAGNFIREATTGEILARYLNHFWEVAGKHFTRYDVPEKVVMYFEDLDGGRSPRYGPFANLSVADGSAHEKDKLVAKFIDPTILWHDVQSDTYWPYMLLTSPELD